MEFKERKPQRESQAKKLKIDFKRSEAGQKNFGRKRDVFDG